MEEKRFEHTITILCLLVAFAAGYGIYYNSTHVSDDSTIKHNAKIGVISKINNEVKRKKQGSYNWDFVESGRDLFYKDTIFVSNDSKINVKLKDNTELILGENTLVMLDFIFDEQTGKKQVAEVKLIRGDLSVKQDKSESGKIDIVLDKKVKINLDKNSTVAISKRNNKANFLVKSGDVKFSVDGKDKKQIPLGGSGPALFKDINLDSDNALEQLDQPEQLRDIASITAEDLLEALPQTDIESSEASDPKLADEALLDELNKSQETAEVLPEPAKELPKKLSLEDESRLSPVISSTQVEAKTRLNGITLRWKTRYEEPSYFLIQIASDENFSEIYTQIKVNDTQKVQPLKNGLFQHEHSLSPVYFAFVPGILRTAHQTGKVYWRALPIDGRGQVLKERPAIQYLSFKFPQRGKLVLKSDVLYNESIFKSKKPTLVLKWRFTHALPGNYKLIVSDNVQFSNNLCTHTISRFDFSEDKTQKSILKQVRNTASLPFYFNETIKLDVRSDCDLEKYLRAKKQLYFKVVTYDPANNLIAYDSPGMPYRRIVYATSPGLNLRR